MKKQRTTWVLTHKYPNGFIRGGIVSNTKLGTRFDVIAYEDWGICPKGKEYRMLRHMSLDETLAHIEALTRSLQIYLERFKPITNKKLRAIYNDEKN